MYFSDALKVLARQWYVVVVGAALMLIGGAAVIQVVSTNYQASGQLLLLPPAEGVPEGGRSNPYMLLPNGLTFTASLLASSVSTPDAQRDMVASGFAAPYAVSVVPGTGPLIVVTAKSTKPAEALATRDELIERIEAQLAEIQASEDVPTAQLVAGRQRDVSDQAEVLAGSKIKALAVLVALGTVLTAIAAFALDRMRSGQRAGAVTEPGGGDDPSTAETTDAESPAAEAPAPTRARTRATQRSTAADPEGANGVGTNETRATAAESAAAPPPSKQRARQPQRRRTEPTRRAR